MTTLEEFKAIEAKEHANEGHGHVFKRPDGMKARCGGPGMCKECAADLARKPDYTKALPALIEVAEKLEDTLWQCLDDLSGGSMEFPGHGVCEAAWNDAKQALAAYEAWEMQIEGGDDA